MAKAKGFLTIRERKEIRQLRKRGFGVRYLLRVFNTSKGMIYSAVRGMSKGVLSLEDQKINQDEKDLRVSTYKIYRWQAKIEGILEDRCLEDRCTKKVFKSYQDYVREDKERKRKKLLSG